MDGSDNEILYPDLHPISPDAPHPHPAQPPWPAELPLQRRVTCYAFREKRWDQSREPR